MELFAAKLSIISYQSLSYVVYSAGRYTVTVLYAEVDVGGSPAHPEVFDSSLVRVGQIGDGILGQPVKFEGTYLQWNVSVKVTYPNS